MTKRNSLLPIRTVKISRTYFPVARAAPMALLAYGQFRGFDCVVFG